ncbi:MAG: DUF2285 domain-containing protein [Caulobacteraceae bacterium]
MRPAGACGFPADPRLAARVAPVYWRPEIAPAVVVRLAPAGPDAGRSLSLTDLDGRWRSADDGLHLKLAGGPQLLIEPGAGPDQALAAILPLDEHFAVRLAAVKALHEALKGGAAGAGRLTRQGRRRLKNMLRAIDGRGAGASYRDIAEHLLSVRVVDSATWRSSAARDVAIRLCRGGARLIRGGYLALLRKRL